MTLPVAREVVPAVGLAFVGGGLLVNLKARADRVRREEAGGSGSSTSTSTSTSTPTPTPIPALASPSLPRHRAGVRFLHWFNALSWLFLASTGTALFSAASFAIFGTGLPRFASQLMGGTAQLLRSHVIWGLLWAAVIVPMFLLFKKGPREILAEVRLTRDDVAWLFTKPLAMAGLRKQPLPPQDKYNAGQKLFAILVLLGTALIIGSGLVMTFHVGTAGVVASAVVVHELAIALVLLGVAIHVTMAAVIAEERPALRSMVTGRIEYLHAKHHSPKWVAELDVREGRRTEGDSQ